MSRPIVALIYDFDKTLSPKDMQEYSFLPGINVEPEVFWGECKKVQDEHDMDSVLAYMLMMKRRSAGTRLLTRESLSKLGQEVEFFPGVETWFERINKIGDEIGVTVEHYIIAKSSKARASQTHSRPFLPQASSTETMESPNGLRPPSTTPPKPNIFSESIKAFWM